MFLNVLMIVYLILSLSIFIFLYRCNHFKYFPYRKGLFDKIEFMFLTVFLSIFGPVFIIGLFICLVMIITIEEIHRIFYR
jgi:hypothetical protein